MAKLFGVRYIAVLNLRWQGHGTEDEIVVDDKLYADITKASGAAVTWTHPRADHVAVLAVDLDSLPPAEAPEHEQHERQFTYHGEWLLRRGLSTPEIDELDRLRVENKRLHIENAHLRVEVTAKSLTNSISFTTSNTTTPRSNSVLLPAEREALQEVQRILGDTDLRLNIVAYLLSPETRAHVMAAITKLCPL